MKHATPIVLLLLGWAAQGIVHTDPARYRRDRHPAQRGSIVRATPPGAGLELLVVGVARNMDAKTALTMTPAGRGRG